MKPRLIALVALLVGILLPARPGGAEYYMGFQYLVGYTQSQGGQIHDGGTIHRFTNRFAFTFADLVDPASVSGNLLVTDGTGATLPWPATVENYTVTLTVPAPLEPAASYTFLVRGGPDGIKSLDNVPMREDLLFRVTTNDLPLALESVFLIGGETSGHVGNNSTMARNTGQVALWFTHPVLPESAAAAIQVTRRDGTDAGWTVAAVNGHEVRLAFPERLPRATEQYRITVAAGEEGLRNIAGEPMPEPATFYLWTLDQPYRWRADFVSNWLDHGIVQNDFYRFRADRGMLSITLWPVQGTPTAVRIILVDEEQNQVLLDESPVFDSGTRFERHLSHAGAYSLYVLSNRLSSAVVIGYELEWATGTPAIALPPMAPFATVNEPLAFAPTVLNPDQTELVGIYLEDLTLAETPPNPDGTVPPVTVDTAGLADEIYWLTVAGKALGSENIGWTELPILVDRVDAFADVPAAHWAHRYVEVMHHLEIVSGRETGLFDPGAPVTRAEFAKLLALTLGLEASPGTANPFVDIGGHWATPQILALWEYGLITGEVVDGQRYFFPGRTITREEAATILGRALGVSSQPVEEPPAFADWDQVPTWAQPSVAALARMGWINGFPDGRYYPDRQLQRDQAAKILAQFFGM